MLTVTLFHSSFFRKYIFYRKNIQYAYNLYATELYVNICRDVFRIQSNIYVGASLEKSQESFIVDVRVGSKCASGIGFTVGCTEWIGLQNVHIYLIWSKSTSKTCHCLLVSQINKKTCWFKSFMTEVSIIKKPVHWSALQMNGLVSIW